MSYKVKGKVLLLVVLSFSFTTFSGGLLETFGQTGQGGGGQGLIRCTAGNLVRTPSECPYTDICPPTPSSPGNVANCTLRESSDLQTTLTELNTTEREALSITTDSPIYEKGKIVNITINNTGTEPLTFPNTILGLQIENSITHEKYPLIATQVITILDSGGSRILKWNQMNAFGRQVEAGNYTVITTTGLSSANTTFTIVNRTG